MGAWGTGILEDDLAVDIYGDYMERYDEGQHTGDIQAELLDSTSDYVLGIPVARRRPRGTAWRSESFSPADPGAAGTASPQDQTPCLRACV
jgi:hypothetical protein